MIIHFHIEYQTRWGEQLYMHIGNKPAYGTKIVPEDIALGNDGRGNWFVKLDAAQIEGAIYHYVLAAEGIVIRTEYSIGHQIACDAAALNDNCTLRVWDSWSEGNTDKVFAAPAFTDCIFKHKSVVRPLVQNLPLTTFTIECEAAEIRRGQALAICGDCDVLGNWDPRKAPCLDASAQPIWNITLDRSKVSFPIEFKFILIDEESHELIEWEDCCNRYFDPGTIEDADSVIVRNLHFNSPQEQWTGKGISVHVTSHRRHPAWEIGNVKELQELADWAIEKELCCIQLLFDDPSTDFDYNIIKLYAAERGLYIGEDIPGDGIVPRCKTNDGAITPELGYFYPSNALSSQEILCTFRFPIDTERCLEPYITVESLKKYGMTERDVEICKRRFFELNDKPQFKLLPQFKSQKAIFTYFNHRPQGERYLCPMMLNAMSDVLFIADQQEKGFYHPRKNALETASYDALEPELQMIYRRIYNEYFFNRNAYLKDMVPIIEIFPLKEYINN